MDAIHEYVFSQGADENRSGISLQPQHQYIAVVCFCKIVPMSFNDNANKQRHKQANKQRKWVCNGNGQNQVFMGRVRMIYIDYNSDNWTSKMLSTTPVKHCYKL